jgi:hypothetical protein
MQLSTVSVRTFVILSYYGSSSGSARAKSYGSGSATLVTGPRQALRIRTNDSTLSTGTQHMCQTCTGNLYHCTFLRSIYKKQDLHDGIKSSLWRVQVTGDLSPFHFLGKAGGVRAKHKNGLIMTITVPRELQRDVVYLC